MKLQATIQGREVRLSGTVPSGLSPAHKLAYQIYDLDNETLLVEGPWTDLAKTVDLRIPLPADGRFRVIASTIEPDQGWSYQHGEPFTLVEAEVSGDETRLIRAQTATLGTLSRRRLGRAIVRAFTYPLGSIWRHRSLIRSMVRRDIIGRYAGSYAGAFWTIIHPLAMMLTYWFVFGVVYRMRFGEDGRSSNFVLYFLAGMAPWLALSEAVGRASTVVIDHANFVKKLVFPIEILPVNLVAAGLVTQFFALLILLASLIGFGVYPTATALYLPLLVIPQVLLTAGLTWFLAALGVLFRDLGQIMGFLLTIWFFTSPIVYEPSMLPSNALWIFELNPMYQLVEMNRDVLLRDSAPPWENYAVLSAVCTALFVAGHAFFHKLKRQFADIV